MKLSLVATVLAGVVAATTANAQTRTVTLRMINGLDQAATFYTIDWMDGKKEKKNDTAITPNSEATSQLKVGKDDMIDVVVSVKAPADSRGNGYFCRRITTSMKDRRELKETFTRSNMKAGGIGC